MKNIPSLSQEESFRSLLNKTFRSASAARTVILVLVSALALLFGAVFKDLVETGWGKILSDPNNIYKIIIVLQIVMAILVTFELNKLGISIEYLPVGDDSHPDDTIRLFSESKALIEKSSSTSECSIWAVNSYLELFKQPITKLADQAIEKARRGYFAALEEKAKTADYRRLIQVKPDEKFTWDDLEDYYRDHFEQLISKKNKSRDPVRVELRKAYPK
jgi:hypothetical protein